MESNVLELGHYAGVGNSLCLYGPFNQSNIGNLQIADNVTRIPEAFLDDAKLTMDELVVDFESVGAFAFLGENISIENLRIVSTYCVFEESYYSTNINHYFNQFAYTDIGSLTLETPSLTIGHVKEKSTTNWVHAPFPIRRCMSLRINFLRIIYLKRFSLHSRLKMIKFKRECKEGVLYE